MQSAEYSSSCLDVSFMNHHVLRLLALRLEQQQQQSCLKQTLIGFKIEAFFKVLKR